jgi:hypothetical protein
VEGSCRRPEGRGEIGRGKRRLFAGSAALLLGWASAAMADPEPQTISGVPQQIIPEVGEVGLPAFTIPTGTVSIGSTSTGTATGGGGTGTSTDSSALDTMLGTSWGASAQQSSEALGVNASALAATCVLESGCQNISGSGLAQGAFQMQPGTFNEMMQNALAADPSLASTIVPGAAGMTDPATEAIAAAEYLKTGAQALEADDISNPTVLDVRGYYNFGAKYGAQIADADGGQTMSSILPANYLSANAITPNETVDQWRASVSAKIGNAASQPVLT